MTSLNYNNCIFSVIMYTITYHFIYTIGGLFLNMSVHSHDERAKSKLNMILQWNISGIICYYY